MVVAVACIFCLVALALTLDPSRAPLSQTTLTVALVLAALSQVLVLVSIGIKVLPQLVFLLRFQAGASEMRRTESRHDLASAIELTRFSTATLETLDLLLSQYSTRTESRLSIVLPKGITIVAVLTSGWSAIQKLPEVRAWWVDHAPWLANQGLASTLTTTVMVVSALVAGLACGAVLKRLELHRVAYHRALIALALQVRPAAAR